MSCSYYVFKSNDFYCLKLKDYVNEDTYYKYCRNYDYDDCPFYKDEGSSSGGCYLTSACVNAKGLEDNCYELEVLRNYRDTWLSSFDKGKKLIQEYYLIAPLIVKRIDNLMTSKEIYDRLFDELVKPCVKLIEEGKREDAMQLYYDVTKELERLYI